MKRFVLLLVSAGLFQYALAQSNTTLKLTPSQVETVFLEQNLELISEKMNVSLADAEIAQAKLWENPNLSIGGVNLWTTSKQREGESEVIPPLFGSFARNTQFTVELSQLIQTANKRNKLISREKIAKDIAIQEFEILLRGLKIELRKSINEIIYLQSYQDVLKLQEKHLNELIASYKKQMLQGNIAKTELFRLQSSLLEVEKEDNETSATLNEEIKNLKTLLSIDPSVQIQIEREPINTIAPSSISLAQLLLQAGENRADIKKAKLQTKYFEKDLAYEKAQRVPDVTISGSYDRFGGVWKDFVGFGISFDIPVLNRNQGAIKAARISRDQSQYVEKQQINQLQHEVVEAYTNYLQTYSLYEKINNNELFAELDSMLDIYTKNLLNRNISMLEYIDFTESYKSNKETILSTLKDVIIQFEELQYVIGTEIK